MIFGRFTFSPSFFEVQQYQQALLHQQALVKQLQPPKHSPEFLASPQEFSPALIPHSKSFPTHVGAALDTPYTTNRQAPSVDVCNEYKDVLYDSPPQSDS